MTMMKSVPKRLERCREQEKIGDSPREFVALDQIFARIDPGQAVTGHAGLIKGTLKATPEPGLNAESGDHVGYERGAPDATQFENSRDGTFAKTVASEIGDIESAVPRDRHGTFSPMLVPKDARRLRKRLFDLAIAIPAVVVAIPFILLLAIGSAISLRAWPFFTQTRVGHLGVEFRFIKIRSLPATAPEAADKYELENVENTRFGRFLRKFHLDELPQLWLVVRGTMSLVGPRPEMPILAATFDPDFVTKRLTVKPGCTGLWQISTASAGLIGENPGYDLLYVRRESIRLDLWILVRTAFEILGVASITSVNDVPVWATLEATPAELLDAAR